MVHKDACEQTVGLRKIEDKPKILLVPCLRRRPSKASIGEENTNQQARTVRRVRLGPSVRLSLNPRVG